MRRLLRQRQARREFPRWPIEACSSSASEDELPARIRAPAATACRSSTSGRTASASRSSSPTTSRAPPASRTSAAGPRGRARARHRLVVELRRRGLPDPGRPVRERCAPTAARSACTASTTTAGCSQSRADASSATLPTIHRYLAEWEAVGFRSPATYRNADWMPRARRPLRQLVPGHRPVRAAGRRLLLDLPVLPRRPRRAADHARPGPHDVGDPAPAGRSTCGARRATWISDNTGSST